MNINTHSVFIYDHIRQVVATDGAYCLCKDNGNMNKNPIKVHRGIDNRLVFRALQPDRTSFNIACDQQVYGRVIDHENGKIVLEKLCGLGPGRGVITLEINSGELERVHAGLYGLVLVRVQDFTSHPGESLVRPIYSDTDNNVAMTLEITDQAQAEPSPEYSILESDWTPDLLINNATGDQTRVFYSSAIPGARVRNHIDGVHTFSTYTLGFTGRLEIWGTLEESPGPYADVSRWFPIYPSTMAPTIEYTNYTGTQAWTFTANFMWLKFRYVPDVHVFDPGRLVKLTVRV